MSKREHISQSEARRLKAIVAEYESWGKNKTNDWSIGRPFNSTLLYTVPDDAVGAWVVQTARRCGHAVVAVNDGRTIQLWGIVSGSKP